MTAMQPSVPRATYAGLFLVTMATLMYEILLTRIFSVIMWYHFAFMAVSVAMFGMTAGAMVIHVMPVRIKSGRTYEILGASSLLFGVFMVLCLLAQWKIPSFTSTAMQMASVTYVISAIPFLLSGMCVCVALTQFPAGNVGKLYAADLIGAALGCAIFAPAIRLGGGPGLVLGLAALALFAAAFFFSHTTSRFWKLLTASLGAGTGILFVVAALLASAQKPLLRISWAKGTREATPIWEKWNSFSRIKVTPDWDVNRPFCWGLSSTYVPEPPLPRELLLEIDSTAGTAITEFDGSTRKLEYLKSDVTNIAHYLRPDARVLAIGAGGGRDVLAALVFHQKSVVGVEINDQIWEAVNRVFGDFTGHLDARPGVSFVNDEARSYLARRKDSFDIIQVSLIDTWAATTAGAFALTENSLYTVEAWELFLRHLSPGGILTVSRWYFQNRPGEFYRLASLATEALLRIGVQNPRLHMAIVHNTGSDKLVGTMLVSNRPFSSADIAVLEAVSQRLNYPVVVDPQHIVDPAFGSLTSPVQRMPFVDSYPLDISAPTDDRPFFFNMIRFQNAVPGRFLAQGTNSVNIMAVFILRDLLVLTLVLLLVFVIVPLLLTVRARGIRGVVPFFVFFAAIGWGFMLIEISQLQRWIVFLGHPIYSLTTVLFVLLLSGGAGSLTTRRISADESARKSRIRFSLLLFFLVLQGLLTTVFIHVFSSAETPVRILIAAALLFPAGLFMGMAFPLGMNLAAVSRAEWLPWFWGVNGGMTVCASVVAVVISLSFGISALYWCGVLCYLVAFGSYLWSERVPRMVQS